MKVDKEILESEFPHKREADDLKEEIWLKIRHKKSMGYYLSRIAAAVIVLLSLGIGVVSHGQRNSMLNEVVQLKNKLKTMQLDSTDNSRLRLLSKTDTIEIINTQYVTKYEKVFVVDTIYKDREVYVTDTVFVKPAYAYGEVPNNDEPSDMMNEQNKGQARELVVDIMTTNKRERNKPSRLVNVNFEPSNNPINPFLRTQKSN